MTSFLPAPSLPLAAVEWTAVHVSPVIAEFLRRRRDENSGGFIWNPPRESPPREMLEGLPMVVDPLVPDGKAVLEGVISEGPQMGLPVIFVWTPVLVPRPAGHG